MNKQTAKICSGNIKTGADIGTWSTLFGNDDYYIPELKAIVSGTCGKHCELCKHVCYVRKSYRYDSVRYRHAVNTVLLRQDVNAVYETLHGQLARKRKPFKVIRINQSGEHESIEQFRLWSRLAADFPKTEFFGYTKAYDIVLPELLAGNVPTNHTVLISIWHENGIAEYKQVCHLPNVKAFVYLDDVWTVEKYQEYGIVIDSFCKAYDDAGKLNKAVTCDKCKKCFDRMHQVVGCYSH